MKYLLVIDDKLIREDAFSQAEKIIKKLDRLEADLESFRNRDQRLFSNWYDLTFREEHKQIADYQEEYRRLSKFHNWMVVVAEMYNVSLGKAFAYLREEEERYDKGTQKDRTEIEKLRLKRDAYIRREIEQEIGYELEDEYDDFDEEEEKTKAEEAPELKMIREMSDQKLSKVCRDRDGAFALLSMCLNYAKAPEDYILLLKVWEATTPQYQLAFSKEYTKETGKSLPQFIEEIREYIDSISAANATDVDDENETLFDDDFMRSSPPLSRFAKKSNLEDNEGIKLLYRKLVRQLHPDLKGEVLNHWQKKMWGRVQEANRRHDKPMLEKLFRMVLIRNQSLNDLTVSEILDSRVWLKEEFESLSLEAHGLKKLPAWGFSRRKNYTSLKKKLSRPFAEQLLNLSDKLQDLKAQHEAIERMSRPRAASPRVRSNDHASESRKKPSRRKKARHQSRSRRPDNSHVNER